MKRPRFFKTMIFVLCTVIVFPVVSLALSVTAKAEYTPAFDVNSQAAYLINLDTGMCIYEKNAYDQMPAAATSAIMSAIVALESDYDLDTSMGVMRPYIQNQLYEKSFQVNVALGGVLLNEELSLRHLLYGAFLRSANDCMMMLADCVGDGSQEYFVEMMNAKAAELGANSTHYVNATGLDAEGQYTTAYDLYLIAKYAMEVPGLLDIASTTVYDTGATNIHSNLHWNTNLGLLTVNSGYYYEPAQGIKLAYTEEAGRCLVTCASSGGYNYLLVLLGAPAKDEAGEWLDTNLALKDAINLFSWAFNSFSVKTVISRGDIVTEMSVRLSSERDYVNLASNETFTYLMPNDIDSSNVSILLDTLPESIDAPISRGDSVGTARLMLAGTEIGMVELIANDNIARSEILYTIELIKSIFRSFWFKFGLILFVLLIVFYISLTVVRNYNKNRSAKYRNVQKRRTF
ncbi:MAG: D-alanyl-D-alanine carboxypeptidase [Ruminococcaceae bacterium]|nr:D-alanyl-D-alanine carboxypeptidase [Oscillospiraceae bacterium]